MVAGDGTLSDIEGSAEVSLLLCADNNDSSAFVLLARANPGLDFEEAL